LKACLGLSERDPEFALEIQRGMAEKNTGKDGRKPKRET
jgi:hypothetical protein